MRDRYGYDVDWDTRGDFLFRDYGLQRAEAPAEGRPASPAWRAGEQRMLAVFGADADCRTPTYRVAMRLFAQRVDAWEAANRAQLTAIRAGWRQRVTDAGTLPKL
jgi:hypothetical protein